MQKRWHRICMIGVCTIFFSASAMALSDAYFDNFTSLNRFRWSMSDGWANGDHQGCEWKENAFSTGTDGLDLTLSDKAGKTRPYTCPEMHTDRRYGYGVYEARMRVAKGSGLNTAFFTYVGPPTGVPEHDEIDAEFLGKDTHFLSAGLWVNGKGQPGKTIPLGFDAAAAFHNYAIEWLPDKIRWYVDGKMQFETAADTPQPHNPGRIYFSLWSGTKVEDSWMGPFHYDGPSKASVAWSSFTPMGEKCLFPDSATCRQHSP